MAAAMIRTPDLDRARGPRACAGHVARLVKETLP